MKSVVESDHDEMRCTLNGLAILVYHSSTLPVAHMSRTQELPLQFGRSPGKLGSAIGGPGHVSQACFREPHVKRERTKLDQDRARVE